MGLSVGDLLVNKYRILKHLGRGSWGDVYLAEDRLLGRQVAVKHLRTGSGDTQTDVDRLLTETRTIARLRHENVVTIYDVLEEKGSYYLVLEYANEGTVADLLQRQGRLAVRQALELGLAAARALEIVHAEGILHGDIKPSNILLVRDRKGVTAKLADFGLARGITGAEDAPGDFFGSVLYAPPEQLHGGTIDRRADLYALGAVLYEMLTGQPPFPYPENVTRVIQSHREASLTPPDQLNAEISPVVSDVVLKALSKAPEERYADARGMGQALSEAIKAHEAWQERIERAWAQAQEHEQHGEWEQAAVCYEGALAEQPTHTEARARLERARENINWEKRYREGGQAYDRGAWAEAEEFLAQVVAYDLDYASGDAAAKLEEARRQRQLADWYTEAQDHEAAERWAEAVDLYLQILAQESDYKDTSARLSHSVDQRKRHDLYLKAQEHLAVQEWAEAVKTLQELEHRAQDHKEVAILLARAQRQKQLHEQYTRACQALNEGEWASAIQAFSRVLELEPEYADAAVKRAIADRQARLAELYDRARAEMAAEEWANAVTTLETIRKIAPAYQDVDSRLEEARGKQHLAELYQEAMTFFGEKKWEQAISRLEQIRQQQPGYPDVEEKLQEAQKTQRLDALYAQARQHEGEQEWDRAIAAYSDILKIDPNHRHARVGLRRASAASLGRGQPGDVENRERRLAVIGALLVVLALSAMLCRPLGLVVGAIFPSPTPTITAAATTPVVALVTGTPTPTPTDTATATFAAPTHPTHTPTVGFTSSPSIDTPTATFTPSCTPTPTPTGAPFTAPTPTPTSTATSTPSATPTATATSIFTCTPIPAPEPLEPQDGAVFMTSDKVHFKWSWFRELQTAEYFALRVWHQETPEEKHSCTWVDASDYRKNNGLLMDLQNPPCHGISFSRGYYYWNVAIVLKTGPDPENNPKDWKLIAESQEVKLYIDVPTPVPTPTDTPVPITPTPTNTLVPPWNPQTPVPSVPPPDYDPNKKCVVPSCAPAPRLSAPENGDSYQVGSTIGLKWTWEYCLPSGWKFAIQISKSSPPQSYLYLDDPTWVSCQDGMSSGFFPVSVELNDSPFYSTGTYYWNIAVSRVMDEGWERLSEVSETRWFTVGNR
ncbi:MAG: protein kinase domain-containing protein [Chloroflexota bacterium]